jgi:hypothetical protein
MLVEANESIDASGVPLHNVGETGQLPLASQDGTSPAGLEGDDDGTWSQEGNNIITSRKITLW